MSVLDDDAGLLIEKDDTAGSLDICLSSKKATLYWFGMDLEKLEKMTRLVLDSIPSRDDYVSTSLMAKVRNVINLAHKALPEHEEFFVNAYEETKSIYYNSEASSALRHILDIIGIEKASQQKIEELRIFESADDKVEQASLSFRNDERSSVFHNLNTALELVLKEKCDIPVTIREINTSKVIDILVSKKLGPYSYLKQAKKRVTEIDNRIKHMGYKPSKNECIYAIKAMEELISKLRKTEIELGEETRNKIYEEL